MEGASLGFHFTRYLIETAGYSPSEMDEMFSTWAALRTKEIQEGRTETPGLREYLQERYPAEWVQYSTMQRLLGA